MASLQAKHSRSCAGGRPWTPFRDALARCSCPDGPVYYVVVRDGGRAEKIRTGRNRKVAERALRKIAVSIDDGDYRPQPNIPFSDWADRWLASLERKPSTVRSYRPTLEYAKAEFGRQAVRRLRAEDIARFSQILREKGITSSTRAKHLRVLGACLESAMRHGYAARNPVRELPPSEKPRPEFKTGMRQGEVLALQWGDVDLVDGVIRVRRSYSGGAVSTPKNHERRDVDLTSDVVELLGWWWGESGRPERSSVLVFPGEGLSGHLSGSNLLRQHLYPAMRRAGIERVGPTGEPRVFHSFRHSFAKRALESGAQITWLSRHLGHSSLKVTTDIYGHWERAERKRQAARLTGVFGV